jgi:hypothetical protein
MLFLTDSTLRISTYARETRRSAALLLKAALKAVSRISSATRPPIKMSIDSDHSTLSLGSHEPFHLNCRISPRLRSCTRSPVNARHICDTRSHVHSDLDGVSGSIPDLSALQFLEGLFVR